MSTAFADQWLDGEVDVEAIYDAISAWHGGEGEDSLAAFLGFTDAEYAAWAQDPEKLAAILIARKYRIAPQDAEALIRDLPEAAARLGPQATARVTEWLERRVRVGA